MGAPHHTPDTQELILLGVYFASLLFYVPTGIPHLYKRHWSFEGTLKFPVKWAGEKKPQGVLNGFLTLNKAT